MRFAWSMKYVSLAVASAFLAAGTAFAQTAATQQPTQSMELVGVNASLDHALNTQTAQPGQAVEAKLDNSVKTAEGVDLPRGTELFGTVDHVQASENGGPASLSLVFTSAQLKDGKRVPVKVTLLSAFPPQANEDGTYGTNLIGPAPRHIGAQQRVDQEPGILHNIAMTSAVEGHDSGTFQKKDGNFKLNRGTVLQVGISPLAGGSATSSGAE